MYVCKKYIKNKFYKSNKFSNSIFLFFNLNESECSIDINDLSQM